MQYIQPSSHGPIAPNEAHLDLSASQCQLTPDATSAMLRTVVSERNRLVAILAVLAIVSIGWGECAGWQATAEARGACCAQEDQCPAHRPGHHRAVSHSTVTQAQADTCCAASERSPSTPSSLVHSGVTLAVVSTPVPALLAQLSLLRDSWRTVVPIASSSVPRHLLLSVFLV